MECKVTMVATPKAWKSRSLRYLKLASGEWSGEKHKAREGTVQNMRMIKKSAKKRTRLKSATYTPHN